VRVWDRYRLRLTRKRLRFRAFRKRRELVPVKNRTRQFGRQAILLFATVRNERPRLPFFLAYYRTLGINHFLIVDNGSEDGTADYLAMQPDVSLWTTDRSYQKARFGIDWMNHLLRRYATGHWALTVDVDEFFTYPYCDTRPIRALTDWLDSYGVRSFPAMLLDMYPKGAVGARIYAEGQNPFEIADHFDSGNYMISRNPLYGNLWIQGGPRARTYFADAPENAPALNKIPLVKWHRAYAYVNSTHMLLPRSLNQTFDTDGGEMTSGCLMHAKFLSLFPVKVREEAERQEHFGQSREYRAYASDDAASVDFWCPFSEKFINWRQLEILGLISKGSWA
jgi:hypothetical protein